MAGGVPVVSGKRLARALERAGWLRVRQGGSADHPKFRHPNKPGAVAVPIHGNQDLPEGTLRNVLRQAGMTADELRDLL